jgi:hypothetical protein
LIFNNVSNAIKFINSIDEKPKAEEKQTFDEGWNPDDDEIPF